MLTVKIPTIFPPLPSRCHSGLMCNLCPESSSLSVCARMWFTSFPLQDGLDLNLADQSALLFLVCQSIVLS